MSLAANLANIANPPKVRVFEPKTEIERDCHWGLWATDHHRNKLRPAIKGEWQRWQLMDHKSKIVHVGSSFTYAVLSSSRYLKLCREQLNTSVQLVQNAVDRVEHNNKLAHLRAGERSFTASQVSRALLLRLCMERGAAARLRVTPCVWRQASWRSCSALRALPSAAGARGARPALACSCV